MKSILRKSTAPHGIIIAFVCLMALFFGILAASRAQAASPQLSAGQRLITVHDGGRERGLLTRATTLRHAFEEANITVDPNDRVEPSLDEKLVANNYEVNVYRARPVTIIDGTLKKRVMSPYRTAQQITQNAGVVLHDEDITAMTASADIVSQGGGIQLEIDRATPFTFVLYGKKIDAYTQETTVGDMLKSKNITLGQNDTLSVAQDAEITAGMRVELWHDGKQTVTEKEKIVFPVQKIQDADKPVGYHKIATRGVNGEKMVTYEITMKGGKEVKRKKIQSVVVKKAKKQVEIIGTKAVLPPGSHQDWMAAAGISSDEFGYVNYIVGREGGWEPCKVQGGAIDCTFNANQMVGYGIVQATPGAKMSSAGGDWKTNPITQLKWATGYAVGRYGSWEGAYNHWLSAHSW